MEVPAEHYCCRTGGTYRASDPLSDMWTGNNLLTVGISRMPQKVRASYHHHAILPN